MVQAVAWVRVCVCSTTRRRTLVRGIVCRGPSLRIGQLLRSADLGTLLTLPFKIVIMIVKKVVIGIPIMVAKSILMALVMALLPLIVVVGAIYWFVIK